MKYTYAGQYHGNWEKPWIILRRAIDVKETLDNHKELYQEYDWETKKWVYSEWAADFHEFCEESKHLTEEEVNEFIKQG